MTTGCSGSKAAQTPVDFTTPVTVCAQGSKDPTKVCTALSQHSLYSNLSIKNYQNWSSFISLVSQLRGPIWEGPVEPSNGTSSATLRKALILLEKSLAFSLLGLQLLSQQQLAHKWPAMMSEQNWEKHIIQPLAQTEERLGEGQRRIKRVGALHPRK